MAVGARIIEKHFTLDKAHSDLRDHVLSGDPTFFRELGGRLDLVKGLLGSGDISPEEAEQVMSHLPAFPDAHA